MTGKSCQPTDGRRTDDHSPVETADSSGLDDEDPFEDDDVTAVLDAAWKELLS